ncbi:MAG: OmpH family outer membrane protein [Deltaproteobacteria bacterium]|nr:MAG: OmpH family outer membrane protein [Deltaproteobacteria bacterium]
MRMTRSVLVLGLVALLGTATAVRAEDVKIGIVDLDQALNATEEGKSAREELERKQREARSKVQPMVERFESLQQEIQGKKFVLSEEVLYQKQLDLIELRNEIESQMKELEGKLKVDQERIVGPLRKKLIDIVQKIGREGGYTVIIERGTPGLLYSREALDLTDSVIAQFDKTG